MCVCPHACVRVHEYMCACVRVRAYGLSAGTRAGATMRTQIVRCSRGDGSARKLNVFNPMSWPFLVVPQGAVTQGGWHKLTNIVQTTQPSDHLHVSHGVRAIRL